VLGAEEDTPDVAGSGTGEKPFTVTVPQAQRDNKSRTSRNRKQGLFIKGSLYWLLVIGYRETHTWPPIPNHQCPVTDTH
jgi:hypothetical protein